jgi:DNA-binding MarR family transcriptional regulator
MDSDGERDRLSAWFALLQTHAAVVDALERKLAHEQGVPLAWHEVLARLAAASEGRLRMLDLAGLILLSKSGVTRLIDRMVEAGLVTREACASDRRVTYAEITEEGRATFQRSQPTFIQGVEEYFASHLSEEELAQLRATLRKVLEGNGVWEEDRCSAPSVEVTEHASV